MSVPRPLAYVLAAAVCVIASLAMGGCKSVNNDVTPSVPVNLNLGSPDLWNTYGVEGFGNYRVFIKSLRVPADFPYSANSATGYGGVLLINGVNPSTRRVLARHPREHAGRRARARGGVSRLRLALRRRGARRKPGLRSRAG